MRAVAALAVAGLAVLPHTAQAQGISYTYVDLAYSDLEVDVAGIDLDAARRALEVGIALAPMVALKAGYSALETERISGVRGELDLLRLEAVIHTDLSEEMDWFVSAGILRGDARASGTSVEDDDTGWTFGVGARHFVTQRVGFDFSVTHDDLFDESLNTFGLTGRYYPADHLGLGLGVQSNDSVSGLTLSLRLEFD